MLEESINLKMFSYLLLKFELQLNHRTVNSLAKLGKTFKDTVMRMIYWMLP